MRLNKTENVTGHPMLSGHVIWTCQKTELMVRVITVLQFWGGKVIALFSLFFMVFLKLGSGLVVFFPPSHKMTKAWVLLACFGLFTDVLRGVNNPVVSCSAFSLPLSVYLLVLPSLSASPTLAMWRLQPPNNAHGHDAKKNWRAIKMQRQLLQLNR